MSFYVTKISGHKELFDAEKFARSLTLSGASKETIEQLLADIEKDPYLRSTKKIYAYALDTLQSKNPVVADRYNIKRALLELGPAGFPFERFVAALFEAQGYHIKTDQIIPGFCVDHEIDIMINEGKSHAIVECKYHNKQHIKTDVKVALYTKARFDDVMKTWAHKDRSLRNAWIVTNTKFTTEAIKYATCSQINLLSWNYPESRSLIDLIKKYGLHPITALVGLSKKDKTTLLKKGLVLCKDAQKHTQAFRELGLGAEAIAQLQQEAIAVCAVD